MKASIIFYDISGLSPGKKEKALRTLWGKEQQSYYGKYVYRSGGILDEILHIKPAKSAVIIEATHEGKVTKALKKLEVKYSVYKTTVRKAALHPRIY